MFSIFVLLLELQYQLQLDILLEVISFIENFSLIIVVSDPYFDIASNIIHFVFSFLFFFVENFVPAISIF